MEHEHIGIAALPTHFASRVEDTDVDAVEIYIYNERLLIELHHQANTHSTYIHFVSFSSPALGRPIRSIKY